MKNLSTMSSTQLDNIKFILTDIDDTLTTEGRLKSDAYEAMERLSNKGYKVIPVTGRCAGWCDHIARMWPVDGVVGENGAFFFSYDHVNKKMNNLYSQTEEERRENFKLLHEIKDTILRSVSGAAVASDQDYRITDLAIDFAEDVPKLPQHKIDEIVQIAEQNGAVAKISSIHVNCWIGNHNKLSTSLKILKESFGLNDTEIQNNAVFIGDSPNDSTMFGFFKNSVGVANVIDLINCIENPPKYIATEFSGDGFIELADLIINKK
ncbi:MAG: HAD-IIB family hydrolase [Gammaproteobacteria bacterium]|mgnify:FL=1|jgi:HAD superfamily hydrolase (TIGR01484 family)|nr:HAD-IIB family hydrolase [Gammaproteobacteria bacterium]MBT4973976.1 HAD-IIB family hydrolase [Gammaproteobacteria bacterium]MDC0596173.1 HAD-IIB family hydrolase [Candidatus Pseudothioglobus singularis]